MLNIPSAADVAEEAMRHIIANPTGKKTKIPFRLCALMNAYFDEVCEYMERRGVNPKLLESDPKAGSFITIY